jgi:hypothetical protein
MFTRWLSVRFLKGIVSPSFVTCSPSLFNIELLLVDLFLKAAGLNAPLSPNQGKQKAPA